MKDDTVKREDVIDLLMHECSASTAGKLIDKVNDLQSGEKPRTDGKLIVKKLAVRAFATYLRDSALIDYPDAGDTIEDWIPTAESALKDVPTEMPLIIHCDDSGSYYSLIPCADTISRQAAIDAFNTDIDELIVGGKGNAEAVEKYLNGVIGRIKELPSAQPEHLDCGDCIENGGDYECDHVHCHKGKSGE